MIDMDEAWALIAERATALESERAALEQALSRIIAMDVTSDIDLPPFDNSAMDGYAIRSADTDSAGDDDPVLLVLHGTIAAGARSELEVAAKTTQRIMTGAPLPPGADAVLQLEHARHRGEVVEVRAPVASGRHVRRRGEDVHAGDLLATRGDRLTTNVAALLANAGVASVQVHRQARVATLATGAELVLPADASALEPGQIYDSNGITMRSLAADAGCVVHDLGIVHDDADAIRDRIASGLDADVLLISGGVSVGRYDHVKQVLADLGMERVFWRVRMKPGKPLLCGRIGSTWVFGLPGNPISCVAGFAAFVDPLLRVLHGGAPNGPMYERARLTIPFSHGGGRRLLATARIQRASDGMLEVTPTRVQGSAMMHALAQSNGFLVVPETVLELSEGASVDVLALP